MKWRMLLPMIVRPELWLNLMLSSAPSQLVLLVDVQPSKLCSRFMPCSMSSQLILHFKYRIHVQIEHLYISHLSSAFCCFCYLSFVNFNSHAFRPDQSETFYIINVLIADAALMCWVVFTSFFSPLFPSTSLLEWRTWRSSWLLGLWFWGDIECWIKLVRDLMVCVHFLFPFIC